MWKSKTTVVNFYETKDQPTKETKKNDKPVAAKTDEKTKMSKYRKVFEDAGFIVEEESGNTLKGTTKDGHRWSVSMKDVEPSAMKTEFDDFDKALKDVCKTVSSSMDELFRTMNSLFHK